MKCKLILALFLCFMTIPLCAEESKVWLSQLDVSKMTCGAAGYVSIANQNIHSTPLKIAGQTYEKGIGTHANSDMTVQVNGAKSFHAEVGVDSESGNAGSVCFAVFGDGKLLWKSDLKYGGDQPDIVDVSVAGMKELYLAINDGDDGINSDRANWANAYFLVEGENPVALEPKSISSSSLMLTDEKCSAHDWVQKNLLQATSPVFSFKYGDQSFAELVSGWNYNEESVALDENRIQHSLTWTDPKTKLEIKLVAVEYQDFPAVEWTVWLQNKGTEETPIISNLLGVDSTFFPKNNTGNGQYKLYHFKGDYYSIDGYEPKEELFHSDKSLTFAPFGGRPTNVEFPYYKIQGPNRGMIFVVSWQGQWESKFQSGQGLLVQAGQQQFHAKLLPGEIVRTPMIFCLFYNGTDYDRSQNLWRNWFLAHNIPRVQGKLIEPFFANYSGRIFSEMEQSNEENQIAYVNLFLDHGIPFDYHWMDAGWYPCQVPNSDRNSWARTGTWKPDPKRFPRGLRAISDYDHSKGVKTKVWFEPERVHPGTELAEEHQDWLLGNPAGTQLLNLSKPEVVDWLSNRVISLIKSEGIDLYRQDFNMEPLDFWRNNDAEDRQGITENLHCQGYLRFWDNIKAAYPDIIIDSCASGGRRNDLETMRRALPLHKTDYNYADLTTKHAFHHSLFQWLPFFGSMNHPGDTQDIYYHRSAYALAYHGSNPGVFNDDFDFDTFRDWMNEWREIAHLFYGDYYPLLPYSRSDKDWIGWQFHLNDSNEGLVQMFKRPESGFIEGCFKLKALDPETIYQVKNFNTNEITQISGKDLMETGIMIRLTKSPDSIVFHYWK